MFRKMAFVLAATAALGAVALSPTSASAWGHGHWGGGHGWGGHGWGWGGFWVRGAAGLVGGAIVGDTFPPRPVFENPLRPGGFCGEVWYLKAPIPFCPHTRLKP